MERRERAAKSLQSLKTKDSLLNDDLVFAFNVAKIIDRRLISEIETGLKVLANALKPPNGYYVNPGQLEYHALFATLESGYVIAMPQLQLLFVHSDIAERNQLLEQAAQTISNLHKANSFYTGFLSAIESRRDQ